MSSEYFGKTITSRDTTELSDVEGEALGRF